MHACCVCNGPTSWNHRAGFWALTMGLWFMSPAIHQWRGRPGRTLTSIALRARKALMAPETPPEKSGKVVVYMAF